MEKLERKQKEWLLRKLKCELREQESRCQYAELNYRNRRKYRRNLKKLNATMVALVG